MDILKKLNPNSLRNVIFLSMLCVVFIPTLFLFKQNEKRAFERELKVVEQGHLVIAKNLSLALSRYAKDLVATFELVINLQGQAAKSESLLSILKTYNFDYIGTLGVNNDLEGYVSKKPFEMPPPSVIAELREEAIIDEPIITSVKRVYGKAVIFVVQRDADGRLFFGAFNTTYFSEIQSEVVFGELGHAMIVDKSGRVLAHPKLEWQETSKDASGLEVVQRMINSETGVMQFYSPALKADMIAGYTHVIGPGWGVMVPQPIRELHQAAKIEATQLFHTLVILFLFTTIISWLLSRLISRPITKLSQVAEKIRQGDFTARFPETSLLNPSELNSAGRVFNNLTDNVVKNREKLEGSLVAANSANTLKTRMISVLSHEMRTPLNGVVGATELLQCTDLTNQQSRYVEIISSSSQTLKEHVNDVLDVGRLESGSIHLNRSTFDIDSLLNEIIAENEPTLLKQGNTVVLQTPDNHPLVVETDLKLIRNIATNLIGNATKFTTGGKVEIILKLTSENELELRVSDNGPGIAKEDFEKIFDPFITLSSNYRRAVDGTGLGLSIVASATKIIGGEYGVESKIGKGSTFWVRFPVLVHAQSPAEQGEIIDLKSYTQDNASGSRRVLIVDDNDINCAVLGEMVKKLGHHVSVANGGKETLNIAMHQPFDLIMLDISMPDLDGIQVAKMLRKNEGCNQSTKIVAQTAHASAEDYDRFLKAGMQDVVIKPIKLKDVKRVICEQIAENLEI